MPADPRADALDALRIEYDGWLPDWEGAMGLLDLLEDAHGRYADEVQARRHQLELLGAPSPGFTRSWEDTEHSTFSERLEAIGTYLQPVADGFGLNG
jgi:hypothetical protein